MSDSTSILHAGILHAGLSGVSLAVAAHRGYTGQYDAARIINPEGTIERIVCTSHGIHEPAS